MKKMLILTILLFTLLKAAYSDGPFAGISAGTPGFVNFNIGYYGDIFGAGVAVSCIHLIQIALLDDSAEEASYDVEEDSGLFLALFQFNFDIKLVDTGDIIFALSGAGGTMCFTDERYPEDDITIFYAGPCIHFIWNGFYIELGAAWGKNFSAKYEGNHTQLFPLGQLGYMFKF